VSSPPVQRSPLQASEKKEKKKIEQPVIDTYSGQPPVLGALALASMATCMFQN
jgi:hypothetical protein